jgi:hypothetical protein
MFSTEFSSGDRDGRRMMVQVAGHLKIARNVPSGSIHQHDGVAAPGDMPADLLEVQGHRFRVDGWQHQGRTLGLSIGQMAPNR